MAGGRASPSSKSEQTKRHSLLQALHRRGVTSRLRLARELNISNSRVCDLVDNMLAEGLLREASLAAARERRGRRGVELRLNPKFGHLVGFDMEAKRLRLVITDFAGEVVWQTRKTFRPPKNRDAFLEEIIEFLEAGITQTRSRFPRLLGIGLAASGVIDSKRGVILHYDLVPQATNIPLRELIAAHFKMPCVIENNIRAMTLAEWTSGAAKGLNTFVCVAVRSGVGAGVVLDGRLLPGVHGLCGEIGYMPIPAADGTWTNFQQTVSECALDVDAEAADFDLPEEVAHRVGELIASQLASIAVVIDPEAIVLGGGILDPQKSLWRCVNEAFGRLVIKDLSGMLPLLPAKLGGFAAAIGAAHRCLYELFPVASNAR